MSKTKLVKTHKGKTFISGRTMESISNYNYEEIIEKGENEIIITASLKINTKAKKGKRMLSEMIEKQNSPIKKVLQEMDKTLHQNLKEDRYLNMYELPEDLKKELNLPDYNDYYKK